MKVLLVNAVNGLSSTGRTVLETARGLEARGVQARICYSAGLASENSYLIGTATEKRIHALCSRVFGKQAYFSSAGTRRLLEYIDDERPDVVHLHNLHGNYIHFPMLLEYLAASDIATVVTLDDCWFYTGKCCHYTSCRCYRWQTGCGSCPRLPLDNPSWFVDATARVWADKKRLFRAIPRLGVIGVSDWVTKEAESSLLSSASVLRRIYNWVDTDTFSPVSGSRDLVGWRDDFVILGVASRWGAAKGLHDFIALAERIRDGCLGSAGGPCRRGEPRVVLVGQIDNRLRLPGNVEHIEATADARGLAVYFSAADVFLQLSREETFGKVTAEALSCGTPAIVYDSTANTEMIRGGVGYAVPPGDLDQLVDRVQKVRFVARESYAVKCRGLAVERFNMEDRIDDHFAMYRELCDLKRTR